jgi:hypothetical protein
MKPGLGLGLSKKRRPTGAGPGPGPGPAKAFIGASPLYFREVALPPAAFTAPDWDARGSDNLILIDVFALPASDAPLRRLEYKLNSDDWVTLGKPEVGTHVIYPAPTGTAFDVMVRAVATQPGPDSDLKDVFTGAPVFAVSASPVYFNEQEEAEMV